MKRIIYALISCCAICTGLFMIIHRNVIAAYLTGKPKPKRRNGIRSSFTGKKKSNEDTGRSCPDVHNVPREFMPVFYL